MKQIILSKSWKGRNDLTLVIFLKGKSKTALTVL
uniref:Uncharacterized protein n=1 Tax=Anguilla anguilla TaxID=7936 RepID=A0A0E9QEX9_ANGAN